ncbi:MAG: hypothetical protein KGY60_09985 [Bacteroidales bacterium]|nr:hypothetical protein [Bacteroidales bacterium]
MAQPRKKPSHQKKRDRSFFDRLNHFFQQHQKKVIVASLLLTVLFSFLLFNFNVSLMGDDGAYIKRAYRLLHYGDFPGFQGPLYPFVLSFFIWIFGLNVTLLKVFSGIFILGHLWFFYKAFRDRMPALLYIFAIVVIATNAYLVSYSSWTFSESLFMFLQAALFYYLLRYIWEADFTSYRQLILRFLMLGLILILLAKTRSIGYGAVGAVMIFFALTRNWKNIAYTLGSFGLFYFLFKGLKGLFFGVTSGIQFGGQLDRLLRVDPYNPSKGQEDLAGFIERFWGNSELYLSKHIYKFLGLRPEVLQPSTILTILTYVLFALALFYAFRKNRYLLFTGIYIAVMSGITFIILQTRWDQERLILVFFPLIVPFLMSGLYYFAQDRKIGLMRVAVPLLMVLLVFSNLGRTFQKVEEHQDTFIHHLQGDDLYGLTPDWVNYVKMCRYAAENVPDSVMIACRKPNIAFIKAKREFHGIFRVNTEDPDKLLEDLKKNQVRYVIMASLRKYPNRKTKYTINTVKRYLYYIQQKYPNALQLVHRIGQDEQAYLFRINYQAKGKG